MIRLLVRLGHWLETRFPEKHEVAKADYDALLQRVSNLEQTAVHKQAVQDVIKVIAQTKNDVASLKTSLGFTAGPEAAKIEAFLSGEPVQQDQNG